MAADKLKLIHDPKGKPHTHHDNWEVMKPFVRFSWGAIKIMAGALIGIVSAVMALKPSKHSTDMQKR